MCRVDPAAGLVASRQRFEVFAACQSSRQQVNLACFSVLDHLNKTICSQALFHSSDSIKCTLLMNFNELKNIVIVLLYFNQHFCSFKSFSICFFPSKKEIYYKPSPRHNNYIYKSKEDSSWYLFQVNFNFNLIIFRTLFWDTDYTQRSLTLGTL
jgi:hypothetical protein